MRTRVSRGFTLIELLVVIAIIGTLIALLLPALGMVKEAANKSRCLSNEHNLVIALKTYANSHQDRYPTCSKINVPTNPTPTTPLFNQQKPGTAASPTTFAAGDAGYSWMVQILNEIEERALFDKISGLSNQFKKCGSFSTTMVDTFSAVGTATAPAPRHFSTYSIPVFVCPSFAGERYVPTGKVTAYDAFQGQDASGQPYGVAISNYMPMTASHIECMKATPGTTTGEPPNGVIVPGNPLKESSIGDGSSKTVIVAETKEQNYSSWYDGSTAFLVACWPSGPTQPTKDTKSGWWVVDTSKNDNSGASIGRGPKPDPAVKYMTTAIGGTVNTNLKVDWEWGPSSDHSGGVVNHVFADGGSRSISKEVDPQVYMHLVTRGGGENDGGDLIGG